MSFMDTAGGAIAEGSSMGGSLLTESVHLERAYLVKAENGPAGALRSMAGMGGAAITSGSIGGDMDDADNAVASTPLSGAANLMRQYVTFAFNPTTISMSRSAVWDDGRTTTGEPSESRAIPISKHSMPRPQFTSSPGRTLTLPEVYLDAVESAVPSVQGDAEFLLSLCAPASGLMGDLMDMIGKAAQPPLVRFVWGAMIGFLSYVTSVSVEYQMFRPNGMPTRAKCSITLNEMPESLLPQNPTSGGLEVLQSHRMVEGESLPVVSYGRLGDARRWRDLAEVNGIDDPLRVAAGRELLLPSRRQPEAGKPEGRQR